MKRKLLSVLILACLFIQLININVLASTTGEYNGTPSVNISSTPNAESNC